MFHLRKFKPGDLVRIKSADIVKTTKRRFHNKFTGMDQSLPTFAITGLLNTLPFAKILVRKRFVVMYNPHIQHHQPEYFLYDNYKPEFFGRGYMVNCQDPGIFVKVGHVSDVRRIPQAAQKYAQDIVESNYGAHTFSKLKGLTREERVVFLNSKPTLMHHEDAGVAYATMMVANQCCPDCREPLISTNIKILHVNEIATSRIKHKAARRLELHGTDHITLFPAGYHCQRCDGLTVMLCAQKQLWEFEAFWCGQAREFVKGV